VTRYAVPGDTFQLGRSYAPSGVVYTYLWTVVDASGNTIDISSGSYNSKCSIHDPYGKPFELLQPPHYLSDRNFFRSNNGLCSNKRLPCLSMFIDQLRADKWSKFPYARRIMRKIYSYTGNAAIAGSNPTAYLNWIVDTTSVATHDATGKCTVDWTKFWSTSGTGAQTHNVIAEVHSIKSNAILSTCTPYSVTVCLRQFTTITPT